MALSALYHRATPPLEASDEAAHLSMVLYIREHRWLPDLRDPASIPFASQEMTQPPLYYALAALASAGCDVSDADDWFIRRPDAPIGRADKPGYKSMWAPRAEPLGGLGDAIQRIRILSMMMGLLTVALVWSLAARCTPNDPLAGFFAGAWVAFNPMFLFISNAVNNDNLVVLLATFALWMATNPRATGSIAGSAALGAVTGLAILAKTSALVLVPALVLALWLHRTSTPGRRLVRAGISVAVAGAVCGLWFVRNGLMYGDIFAFAVHESLIGNGRPEVDPWALLREWDGFIKSYWGVFGGFNVIYTDAVYLVFFAITALVVAATTIHLARVRGRDPVALVLGAAAVLNVIAVGYWTSKLLGSQGRLLFPTIGAHAALWVLALSGWGAWGRGVRIAACIAMAALAFLGAWAVIPAEYPP